MQPPDPQSVLVVEDEAPIRELLLRQLRNWAFEAESVDSAGHCLERLDKAPLPDVILMDTKMPNMTGLELLGCVRAKWPRDRLPVIMVSGWSDPGDIVTGLEAGANDYVVKPIQMAVLRARIQVCLETKASVDDLVDAERQRVMLESLGSACHHIAQPMTPVLATLDGMLMGSQANCARCRGHLREVRSWARQVADVLHRLQGVLTYRTVPYACGTNIVDIDTTPTLHIDDELPQSPSAPRAGQEPQGPTSCDPTAYAF